MMEIKFEWKKYQRNLLPMGLCPIHKTIWDYFEHGIKFVVYS